MRRAWLSTMAAALCAVATTSLPADASPAAMTRGVRPVASTSTESWTDRLKFWDKTPAAPGSPTVAAKMAAKPTETTSPWRHPIDYFSASVSEMPGVSSLKSGKNEHQASKKPDSLSLETPPGPTTPQFYIAVAQMSERQGKLPDARKQLQLGLAKWPRDVELLRAAARMEDRQGNLPLAETLYRRAVTADSQNAGALNDLGLCLARQGKLEQSVQSIEQSINLQPDKALYRNNAATVLVEMHQDQRALAHLSAVHGPAEASYNLGQLLVDRGRPHEAVAYFQRAVDLDPSMESAQMAIAQLRGTPTAPTQVAAEPAVPQQDVTPSYGPQLVPQQPVAEPKFPATARGPAPNTSSYVPPTSYYPAAAAPSANPTSTPVYQTATAPRYLPPVRPITPGSMVR